MKTISKLLIATAIVASVAAPAFAVDYNSELQANRTTPAAAPVQSGNGTSAYAMDKDMRVSQPAGQVRGFDQINGGM